MLSIPLYTILFAYVIIFALFVVFSIINFYHILTAGAFTFASFAVSFLVFALTILTLYFTWYLLIDINWQAPFTLFNESWIPDVLRF